jgi:hypothetical protein
VSYQITLSNGSVLVNVADNSLDNSTSLTLVGQNFLGYGTAIADNFVRLLENAANTTSPVKPLVGQLWYDTAHSLMKVWTGTIWFALATGVSSVVTKTGDVTFSQLIASGIAPQVSPIFTGVPQAPTAALGTSTNQIASTAFVIGEITSLSTGVISVIGNTGIVTLNQLIAGGLAPIASPTLTGIPKVPTAPTGTNTTQIASTAFVLASISSISAGVISVVGFTGIVTLANLINGGVAPIASPSFTGIPQCATAPPGTSNNQIADTAFVTQAIAAIPVSPTPPKNRLPAPLNLYVATTGNDANDGLTVSTAFRTLQKAWNTILYNYDMNGFLVTVNVADGTYGGVVCSGAPVGASLFANLQATPPIFGSSYGGPAPVKFMSSSGNASRCIVSTTNQSCFLASFGAQIDVTSMSLTAAGGAQGNNTNGSALVCTNGGYIGSNSNIFLTCGNSHVEAYGGLIDMNDSNTISGGASVCLQAARMGHVNANGTILNITGSPFFSSAFVVSQFHSLVEIGGATFNNAGNVGGAKFLAQIGGVIATDGSDPNSYLPGNISGNADGSTFGLYV